MTTAISELQAMTESQKMYRIYERMEEMYESNYDWDNALKAKWGMVKWAGEGI